MSRRLAFLVLGVALTAPVPAALGHEAVRLDVISPGPDTTVPAGPVDVQITATPLVALVGATSFTLTIDERPVARDGSLGERGGAGLPFLVRPEETVALTVDPGTGSHMLEVRYLPDIDVGEVVLQVRFAVAGGGAGGAVARVAMIAFAAAVVAAAVLVARRRRGGRTSRDTPPTVVREEGHA